MSRTVGVIGGGVIGAGWAARFALMGWHVRVHDPDPQAGRKLDAVMAGDLDEIIDALTADHQAALLSEMER